MVHVDLSLHSIITKVMVVSVRDAMSKTTARATTAEEIVAVIDAELSKPRQYRTNLDAEIAQASMTPELANALFRLVAATSADDEVAHGLEDDACSHVLRAIAEGRCDRPAECAAEVLKTKALDFSRWCA